jgi:N-acetylneuraminic acid mutarotase
LPRLIGLAALAAAVAPAAAAAASPGQRAAPLANARGAHAVATDGRAVYALGGTNANGQPVAAVERFDGTRWSVVTQLPAALNMPAAAYLGGKLYVLGGFAGVSNTPVSATRVFDVRARTWSTAAALPSPRGGHAAVVLNGRIHVLGGGNEERTLADHSVYDPVADRWTERAPLPRSKGSVAAVVHAGRLYSIGGRSGTADYGDVQVYDAAADRWVAGPRIGPRGTSGAVSYRGSIFVFGGESQASGTTLNAVLRLQGRTWKRVATMPTARSFARAVVFRNAVYVVGGSRFFGAGHSVSGSRSVDRYFVRR